MTYTDYTQLCQNADLPAMSEKDWNNLSYEQHVKTAATPLSEEFYKEHIVPSDEDGGVERLQSVADSYEDQKASLWLRIDQLCDENRQLHEKLKSRDYTIDVNTTEVEKALREAEESLQYAGATVRFMQEQIDKITLERDVALTAVEEAKKWISSIEHKKTTPANQPKYPHYFVEVPTNTTHVDMSWIFKAFNVPVCEAHAIKKLMAAGKRGAKDRVQDLMEARASIDRAIELEDTK